MCVHFSCRCRHVILCLTTSLLDVGFHHELFVLMLLCCLSSLSCFSPAQKEQQFRNLCPVCTARGVLNRLTSRCQTVRLRGPSVCRWISWDSSTGDGWWRPVEWARRTRRARRAGPLYTWEEVWCCKLHTVGQKTSRRVFCHQPLRWTGRHRYAGYFLSKDFSIHLIEILNSYFFFTISKYVHEQQRVVWTLSLDQLSQVEDLEG